jgi:hypothetical protein
VSGEKSSKLQAPSSREIPRPKLAKERRDFFIFGVRSLIILWSLEVGIWSFSDEFFCGEMISS